VNMRKAKVNFPFEGMFEDKFVEQIKQKEFRRSRTIYIDGEINDSTSIRVQYMLENIAKNDEKELKTIEDAEPIIIKINSPGGDVYSTMSIMSCIESLKEQGFKIHTYALGLAMSGAFKIFIVGTKRFCQKNTHFMCHQPNSFEYGVSTFVEKERNVEITRQIWLKLKIEIVRYTDITMEELDIITDRNYDWYMWAEEAIAKNVVDVII